jgi:Papain fold toxin 1, glutamine deamidase
VRIEVEPDVLINAGQRMESLGSQLGMLSDALGSSLGSGIASGTDPAGLDFGLKYGHQAQEFADTLAKAANSFKSVGCALQATGYNYKNADAASTVRGPGPSGGVTGEPSQTMPAHIPAGPNGAMVPPPPGWWLIQPLLQALPGLGLIAGAAMTWPSGHPALLSVLAVQWRNFATGFAIFQPEVDALKSSVGAQMIPEANQIGLAFDQLGQSMKSLADASLTMAQSVTDFAGGVEQTQDAIRRLLDRLSFEGLWDTVTGFLTGEGDDILREVARDVGTVLNNFQQQVKGIVGLLGELTALIGDAATTFEKWIRPVLVAQFGDGVGNFLADAVTLYTDFEVGLTTGLINTVSGVVSMADIDTWKGMADVAMSVAEDPTKLPGVLENMGKEFVAWDQWSGDHPGRAAGEAAFNIGSLFVPGGALSKTGTVAKSLNMTRRVLDEGRLPRFGEIGSWGRGTPKLDEMGDLPGAGHGLPEAPEFKPAAVPDSVIGPAAPHGVDAPTAPRGLESPAGPPDPPGPTSTPGGGSHQGAGPGGGPPPDPPGRVDSPQPSAPGSVESPRLSDPPAPSHAPSLGEQTPSSAPHTPESHSPASTHDSGPSPSEHRGGGSDVGHNAPSENHRPSEGHSGRPEGPAHGPADHPATHIPAAEQPSGHERPVTDGGHTRTPGDGDAGHHQAAGTAPTPMAGMPMAPHSAGGMHSPGDAHASSGRTSTPETPTRNPDARSWQGNPPDSPRAQGNAAAGPATGSTPTAPVKPAAAPHVSDAMGEPLRPGLEPHSQRPGEGSRESSPTTHETPRVAGHHPDPSVPNHGAGSARGQSPDRPGPVGNPAEARLYGPHELDHVEDPAYQTAVEESLRDSHGEYLRHADPRTNDYGNLINDGGPSVDGRSNNCLDCSLSALSSFRGEPTVAAPRYLDESQDGTIDRESGEQSGLRRAEDWLGKGLLEFRGLPLAHQFDALHQHLADLGPGSSALVVNGWHARDLHTGEYLYHSDGSPITRGSHATVVVYPEGAHGPVWWDPQQGLTSDRPPSWMVDQSTHLYFTPIEPSQGAHHGGVGNQGTGAGVSGTNVTDRDLSRPTVQGRMGMHQGSDPGTDDIGPSGGAGPAGDRFGDRDRLSVPELVGDHGGRSAHDVQTDGRQPSREPDLPVSVGDHDSTHPGGWGEDRLSSDSRVSDQSAPTDPTASPDDREEHVPFRSEGSAVEGGSVPREVGERSEPGSLAGDGHDPQVTSHYSDRSAGDFWDPYSDDKHSGSQPELHADSPIHEGSDRAAANRSTHDGHAGPEDYEDTEPADVPISREKFDEILATEKGQRPPPESYLPLEYIVAHLRNFEGGATRILIRSDFEEYGIGKPDAGRSEFVLTREAADTMIAESGGSPINLAQKLGIPEDQLANDSLVILEFHRTDSYTAHMPSGNEWGANDQWLPGGKLPRGDLEAIVPTEGMVNGRDYTARDIATGEIL